MKLVIIQARFINIVFVNINPLPKQYFFSLTLSSLISFEKSLSDLCIILEKPIWIFSELSSSRIASTHYNIFHGINTFCQIMCSHV